jgi:glycosyl-4,4'-diaponeurosporenoate acyltransferase
VRIVILSPWLTLLVDFAAWAAFQVAVSWLGLRFPDRWFENPVGLFRTRPFEQEGRWYERVLRIRAWKRYLPDGGGLFRRGFRKKRMDAGADSGYIARYLLESRRAELTHLLSILPCALFFLWNPPAAGWVMVGFALLQNLPCIAAQRYNRPRFERLAMQRARRTGEGREDA